MKKLTIRLSDEQHEKLRWLAYKEDRSQHDLLLEWIERELAKVTVPEAARKEAK